MLVVFFFMQGHLCSMKPIVRSNPVATLVDAPKVGRTTIGGILATLNRGYSGSGTFLLITDAAGKPIAANDLVPNGSGWTRYAGSKSVNMVFGQAFTQKLPPSQVITLLADQALIAKMQATSRLPSGPTAAAINNNALNRVFLYFVYPVQGVNYRFYINDPCPPAGMVFPGRPPVYPAVTTIINRFKY